jgi:hypothetical protein
LPFLQKIVATAKNKTMSEDCQKQKQQSKVRAQFLQSSYQLAFLIPGKRPFAASSRNMIREILK